MYAHAKLLQLCPSICTPVDYNLSGSSVHGILQARILECVIISSSRRYVYFIAILTINKIMAHKMPAYMYVLSES